MDTHLRQFTPKIPSYVKDTTHFINIMRNIQLDPDDLLVTIDVSSLYTNIPHTEGIVAINRMMEEIGTDTLSKNVHIQLSLSSTHQELFQLQWYII